MKFTTVALALFASVSAIQMELKDLPTTDPTTDPTDETVTPAVMPPIADLASATKDKRHMIGTHFLLHAKKDIDALLLEAKNSEHDANTDKIEEIKQEIEELKKHMDILNAAHAGHADEVPTESTLVQETSGSDDDQE